MRTGLDDSFCSSMSFREAVEVVYYIACTQERVNEILIVVFHFMKCTATILTFSFTDPVEELLLTELDDSFISRVSFREAVANSKE